MNNENYKVIFKTSILGLLYLVFVYVMYIYLNSKDFILLSELNVTNIMTRVFQDFLLGLLIPIIILIRFSKNLNQLGFTNKNLILCLILILIYFLFFILHSNYSLSGIYRSLFYLIVGFSEEVIIRGYFYLRIKSINRLSAVIISGLIFGAAHAILPGINAGHSAAIIGLDMLNFIGGGIVGGLIFIFCMELSGNILVAILIHSLLDYSYKGLALVALLFTLGFLIYKNRVMIKSKLRNQQ